MRSCLSATPYCRAKYLYRRKTCLCIPAQHFCHFLYDTTHLISCGIAISNGSYQAAIYDFAIYLKYQVQGLGKKIITHFMEQLEELNIMLMFLQKKGIFISISVFSQDKPAFYALLIKRPSIKKDLQTNQRNCSISF